MRLIPASTSSSSRSYRALEQELGLRIVSSVRAPDAKTRAAGRNEFEEARRLGTDLKRIRNTISDCLHRADSGTAFAAALDAAGLVLAAGDRRDCFVVVDQAGGHHALNKKLTGLSLVEIRQRLHDLDRALLPDVTKAKARQRQPARETAPVMPPNGGAAMLPQATYKCALAEFAGACAEAVETQEHAAVPIRPECRFVHPRPRSARGSCQLQGGVCRIWFRRLTRALTTHEMNTARIGKTEAEPPSARLAECSAAERRRGRAPRPARDTLRRATSLMF